MMNIKNIVLHEGNQEQKEDMCCDSIYMKFKEGKVNCGNKNQNSCCFSVYVCMVGAEARGVGSKGWRGNFCVKEIVYVLFGMG